ncbi:MAG TPA: glycosyltransferase family 4 protein, partial [Candidatus Eisenbacteria bacterium]|nr:glycosyltransferase family 4 protein [Candidatus Eisenbacteria bacterium]
MSRGRVCMFVEYLYPVVSGGRVPFAGGIEVQLALLARGLARRGFEVTVVTGDFGQPDGLVVDGVRLTTCYPPAAGVPVLRFFHPRLTGAVRALWRADADVYVFRGVAMWAGVVADVAHLRGRAYVQLVGHDHDVRADLPDVHGPRDRWWARRALLGADAVVTQTEGQRRTLAAAFGRDATVIMNAVELPPVAADAGAGAAIAWLSTYKPGKRPEWFTRFAERHPDVRCRMAGVIPLPPLTDAAYRAAREVAARCPNLEVAGTIPHERIGDFLRGAGVLAHSSPAEGFPNVFLEAWALGLPCVTAFDPDGILARERLGECHATYEAWEAALERYARDPALRRDAGGRARAYAAAHHGSGAVVD